MIAAPPATLPGLYDERFGRCSEPDSQRTAEAGAPKPALALYFTSRRAGSLSEDIYVMDADGNNVMPLFVAPGTDADAAVR